MLRTRKYTRLLLQMVDEGVINRDMLIADLLDYMSEKEVQVFVYNEYSDFLEITC